MDEKWTRVVIHDPHGNVIADRPLSPEGATEQVAQHNADPDAHPAIREAIVGMRTQVGRRLVGAKVKFSDGHTEDVELGVNDQGEVILLLPKETFGKIDGVLVNGEELPVDDNGKVDITIPTSVSELEDANDYATKEEAQAMVDEAKVTGASVDYQEDGGSPSATVDFSEGRLGFTLKNMKMKFSELSPEEVAAITGPQGIPGDNCIPLEGESPLAQVLSQATDKAITPKAVQDALLASWQSKTYKIINDLILDNAPHVGDIGNYSSSSASLNFKLIYTPVNQGDLIKISANVVGPLSVAISSDVPANGISATRLYYKSHNGTDPAVSLERILEMPSSGYLAVVAKVELNTYMPTIRIADKTADIAKMANENTFVRKGIELGEDELSFTLTSLNLFSDVSGSQTNLSRGKVVTIVPGKFYILTSNSNTVAGILKTGTVSSGAANFSDEYTSRITVDANGFVFQAPSDAHYVFLQTKISSGSDTGIRIEEIEFTNDIINTIRDGISLNYLDLKEVEHEFLMIASNGIWSRPSNANAGSKTIPVRKGVTYSIFTSNIATNISVLKTSTRSQGSPASFSNYYPSRVRIEANSACVIKVPSDANYINIYTHGASGDLGIMVYEHITGADVSSNSDLNEKDALEVRKRIAEIIGNPLRPMTYNLSDSGEEIPTTKEVLWMQKKAKQVTNLKWTPLKTVPKNNGNNNFTAGVEVTGMPYSSVKEIDKYIGFDVSIHTFMTAVNNPYSLIYTESLRADRSASAWGRTYHGLNCGCYMGVVCSALTCWCVGQEHELATAVHAWCATHKLNMIKVHDQSINGLQLGDLYWKQGHVELIVGLKRDSDGNVTHVQISEADVEYAKQKPWKTAEEYNTMFTSDHAIIYRNIELYKVRYEPSVFVPVDDEIVEPFEYNDDICTFAGDKASFREGELVVLNYNLKVNSGVWNSIEVYKDGDLFGAYPLDEIDQNDLPESQQGHALKLEHLEAGKYKARLTGNDAYSDWTMWEMVQAEVSAHKNGNFVAISWDSANGIPNAWSVCNISGTVFASDVLTDEQISMKKIEINLTKYVLEQRHKFVDEDAYVKVHFKSEYGRVTNEPIMITE